MNRFLVGLFCTSLAFGGCKFKFPDKTEIMKHGIFEAMRAGTLLHEIAEDLGYSPNDTILEGPYTQDRGTNGFSPPLSIKTIIFKGDKYILKYYADGGIEIRQISKNKEIYIGTISGNQTIAPSNMFHKYKST